MSDKMATPDVDFDKEDECDESVTKDECDDSKTMTASFCNPVYQQDNSIDVFHSAAEIKEEFGKYEGSGNQFLNNLEKTTNPSELTSRRDHFKMIPILILSLT